MAAADCWSSSRGGKLVCINIMANINIRVAVKRDVGAETYVLSVAKSEKYNITLVNFCYCTTDHYCE